MKNLNNTKISLGKILPRLNSTDDAPVKLIFVVLYIVGAVLVWNTQTDIAAVTENIQFISPLAVFAARNLLSVYLYSHVISICKRFSRSRNSIGTGAETNCCGCCWCNYC